MTDAECGAGNLCACHGSPYVSGGNGCIAGNCRVDADCDGGNGYCSPSSEGCGGLSGYFCHTRQDGCLDDSDCPSGTNGPQQCSWSSGDNHWKCVPELLCG